MTRPLPSPTPPATRVLPLALAAVVSLPPWPVTHAAKLALSQVPPAAVQPPAPNVIVTLDDSNSMTAEVAFDASQAYPVPPEASGVPIATMPAAPNTYANGYQTPLETVALTGKYKTAYDALAADLRPAYLRWYAFYRTRLMAMRGTVMRTFTPANVPDGKIRLAWQGLIGSCYSGFPADNCTIGGTTLNNAMWPLDNLTGGRTHRSNFYQWVRSMPNALGTPTRSAYARAGEYLLKSGDKNSPWSHLPGAEQSPELSCRRSYQLLFTDGEWTSGGSWEDAKFENVSSALRSVDNDNANVTLPDGKLYTQQNPYAGPTTRGSGTLADLAFKYWATDLQTGKNFSNDVPPVMKVTSSQSYGTATVEPYWNPANNPATWQHLVTFGIGFGSAADITAPDWQGSTHAGADFAKLVDGSAAWPGVNNNAGKRADLWHMAVNSRGLMFPASDQAGLDAAFQSILGEIIAQNVAAGGAVSSYVLEGEGFRLVRAGYVSNPALQGTLEGYGLKDGQLANAPVWDGQKTLSSTAHGSRVVLTASSASAGVALRWDKLSDYQKAGLNTRLDGASDSLGADRLNYLRGDSSKEKSPGAAAGAVFRWRPGAEAGTSAVLGTITNAEPKVVAAPRAGYPNTDYQSFRKANLSRTAVAYVGANDGMLHGFKASDGTPVLSYVPRGVFPNLGAYTDPTFTHRMFVDGPIITADYKDGSTWKTLLVGALGSGGRGLFALDVTDPTSFKEASAASIVKFDYTAPAVGQTPAAFTSEAGTTGMMAEIATDLGHIVGDPSRDAFVGRNLQVARMRNDKWALIFGNGLNSVNERAALYILYLDGSGLRKLLPETATGQGNGLATPLPVDVDGDGRVDLVYAGDHLGRLWKFELAGSDDTQWKVAQISGVNKPVIDTGRPITSAPAVAHHPGGGLLVTFGTGRLLTDGDRNSTATETLYGVWDKPGGPHAVTDSDLVARTLSATDTAADGSTVRVRVLDASPTRVDYAKQRGWKIALGMSKERNIYNPIVQGRLVYYSTHVPASSSACSSVAQGGSLLSFDVISGSEPEAPVIDINGDGLFTTADRISEKTVMGRSAGVGRLIALAQARPNDKGNVSCAGDTVLGASGMICAKKPLGPGRRAWRDMRP